MLKAENNLFLQLYPSVQETGIIYSDKRVEHRKITHFPFRKSLQLYSSCVLLQFSNYLENHMKPQ